MTRMVTVLAACAVLTAAGCLPHSQPKLPAPVAQGDVADPGAVTPFICGGPGGAGIGGAGPTLAVVIPRSNDLDTGFGVGVAKDAFWMGLARWDAGLRSVSSERGDSGGMLEASMGLGCIVHAGLGGALPLWDEGNLELKACFLGYAGIWIPLGNAALTARYTWYSEDGELDGRDVALDGWGVNFRFNVKF